jgi:hypothetical protein
MKNSVRHFADSDNLHDSRDAPGCRKVERNQRILS